MRNISFALTADQIINQEKTVTRRLGWRQLKPGDRLQPVKKCMGLRKGEKVQLLCDPITVVSARREPINAMLLDLDYGFAECKKEGFGWHPDYKWPCCFVDFFLATHKGATVETEVTRIEFSYEAD